VDTQIAKLKPKTANNKMAAIFAKLWRANGYKNCESRDFYIVCRSAGGFYWLEGDETATKQFFYV